MSLLESLDRSSGHHRIVWEVTYAYDHYHRVDDGYGDTRPAGMTRERRVVHIIAPTLELAKAAFTYQFPPHANYDGVCFDPICTIEHEIGFTNWRHGT